MGKLKEAMMHPEEIWPLAQMAVAAWRAKLLPKDDNLSFCYDMLNRVSRSFAVVIQQLPVELRDAVCVFYLVLRALDTVEDDMAIPAATKLPILKAFWRHVYDRDWSMKCGAGAYADLMANYGRVTRAFLRLRPHYQEVIVNITRRMGAGMAEFIAREVISVADYDLYCHYVAGLVGIGLSQLFAHSGLEDPGLAGEEALSNHMGLLLQKTNIIRDYLEDISELPAPRMFWPREVWGAFAVRLEDFRDPANSPAAVACLNRLVADALRHAPGALAYLGRLKNRAVFRFCALPQVMALATLALCYNNPAVFTGVVKMRRGEAARHMVGLQTQPDLFAAFAYYARQLAAKAEAHAGSNTDAAEARWRAAAVEQLCTKAAAACPPRPLDAGRLAWLLCALLPLLAALWWALAPRLAVT